MQHGNFAPPEAQPSYPSLLQRPNFLRVSLHHPRTGHSAQDWTFQNRSAVRIGRSSDNDVVLHSSIVSRYHMRLTLTQGLWSIQSIGMNGIYIDGILTSIGWVEHGTKIRIGKSGPMLQLWLYEPELPTEAPDIDSSHAESVCMSTFVGR
ncbi:MAG: FHA domain-containing protein [Elainellaceae cyanobacterium]